MNSEFGKNLKITIGGGSHEKFMTLLIQGLPAGEKIDMTKVCAFMKRRAPGRNSYSTSRFEEDIPLLRENKSFKQVKEFTVPASGKIDFIVENRNFRISDYNLVLPRPGHADYPAYIKYKGSVNMSGGGPFSGRMTAMLCLAGGICIQILEKYNILIGSSVYSIGKCIGNPIDAMNPHSSGPTDDMIKEIIKAKNTGDSLGGTVEAFATGLPCGLGGPMYDGVESIIAPILFGIPAVKGVEFGSGFRSATMKGSENNDSFIPSPSKNTILTASNNHGGILGGITTGMPLTLKVAFKPVPSIGIPQNTVNLMTGETEKLTVSGRHDPCIVPRGTVIVESALAVAILDMLITFNQDTVNLEKKGEYDLKALDLNIMRSKIDDIDNQLISLLNKRMEISEEIARYKKINDIPVLDSRREKQILLKAGINYENIFREIFHESRRRQHEKNTLAEIYQIKEEQ